MTPTITSNEMMTALGLGKKSRTSFWNYERKFPEGFVCLERDRAPKPNLYRREPFERWLKKRNEAKQVLEGKE